eukprot:648847-Pyramimonas_sp.AAC.1
MMWNAVLVDARSRMAVEMAARGGGLPRGRQDGQRRPCRSITPWAAVRTHPRRPRARLFECPDRAQPDQQAVLDSVLAEGGGGRGQGASRPAGQSDALQVQGLSLIHISEPTRPEPI